MRGRPAAASKKKLMQLEVGENLYIIKMNRVSKEESDYGRGIEGTRKAADSKKLTPKERNPKIHGARWQIPEGDGAKAGNLGTQQNPWGSLRTQKELKEAPKEERVGKHERCCGRRRCFCSCLSPGLEQTFSGREFFKT